MNCFGALSREAGQSRVPAPPLMINGTTFCIMPILAPFPVGAHRSGSDRGGQAGWGATATTGRRNGPPPMPRSQSRPPRSGDEKIVVGESETLVELSKFDRGPPADAVRIIEKGTGRLV